MKSLMKVMIGVCWIISFSNDIYSQQCDDCPTPMVLLYGMKLSVPLPPQDTSASYLNKYLNWIALLNVQQANFNNDPEYNCISWLDGSVVGLTTNPLDTTAAVQIQTNYDGNVPPSGSVQGGDYLIWSSLDSSSGQFNYYIYLEDATTRDRIAVGEAHFTSTNDSQNQAQLAINQIEPVFDKIRAYQKMLRDKNSGMAIHAKINIIPSKSEMKGDETIPVNFQLYDCDGGAANSPLGNRWIKIISTLGRFDKDSVETDASGSASANFTANNVTDVANLSAYYFPYTTVYHKTNGASGDTTVNINKTTNDNWILSYKINGILTDNSKTEDQGFTSLNSETTITIANVTQFVVGKFTDTSISIDHVVGGKGDFSYGDIKRIIQASTNYYSSSTTSEIGEAVSDSDLSHSFVFILGDDFSGHNLIATAICSTIVNMEDYELSNGKTTQIDSTWNWGEISSFPVFATAQNSTYTKSGAGYLFQGNSISDTVIDLSPGTETIHKSFTALISIQPYNKPTNINNSKNLLPDNFLLSQNYPNPFNPSTIIEYQIPKFSHVSLNIYDVVANKIATLVDRGKPAGKYSVNFNASNLSSGVYFYRIVAGSFVQTKKLILMK